MERLQGSHSVLGWNDSTGVFLSRDGITPGESFYPEMERLQGSHSVLGWNDPRTEGLQSSNSVLGWNNNWIVLLSWDRTTPGESFCPGGTTPVESFCPGMERHQGSHSVLGWNDSRVVILSWDGTIPGESFCPEIQRLQRSHSVLG